MVRGLGALGLMQCALFRILTVSIFTFIPSMFEPPSGRYIFVTDVAPWRTDVNRQLAVSPLLYVLLMGYQDVTATFSTRRYCR